MTLYRATLAGVESRRVRLPGPDWRAALRVYLADGWRMFKILAEQDAERMKNTC